MSEAKNSIDPNAANYTKVRAAHILVETKSQAQGLKNRIEGGEEFGAMAKQFSKCPSGQRGGDLGYFGRGQWCLNLKPQLLICQKANYQNLSKLISAGT